MPEEEKLDFIQSETNQKISDKIEREHAKFRNNRNRLFPQFRGRDCLAYWNDSNMRFNNYRVKPDWKDEWQANISDTTTHSKLMAIVAQVVVNRMKPEFYPRNQIDFFAVFKAQLLQNLYEYTDTCGRNGDIDDLFTAIRAAREGTVIGFEGWKKTKFGEGIDAQFVRLEDFFPGDITKFDMFDQTKAIWRTVMTEDDFKEKYYGWYQVEKVKCGGAMSQEERTLYKLDEELEGDKVAIKRYFNLLDDEFYVTANGILITKPDSKLSDRRKDKRMGFWKAVYEPYDDFFYGRSLPDLMADSQDAIDFLFNALFDREMLAVLRPILSGGINQLTNDYLYPGRFISVADVNQIRELDFSGPDLTSFRVLKELQDRQHFVSTDPTSQGVSLGQRTATEVERAQEAARRIFALFSILLKDGLRQKAILRGGTIQQFMLTQEKFEPLILQNAKLFTGKTGIKVIRAKSKPSPSNVFGYSRKLELENMLIPGESEIIEFNPKKLEDFEFSVGVRIPNSVEMSEALKKAFDREFASVAFARPDVYDQKVVARNFAVSMNQNPEEVVSNGQEQSGQIPGSELVNQLTPTNKRAVPSLKSLINSPL